MAPPELEDIEDQSSLEASTMINGAMLSILMGVKSSFVHGVVMNLDL
jgi:hypothetical protein